jgi:hypothetical protein
MPMQNSASPADARDIGLALLFGTIAQDQRRALPVGDPVRGHRRAGAQQFLHHHEPGKWPALLPAISPGQRQPQEPRLPQRTAERGIEALPRSRPPIRRQSRDVTGDEGPDLRAQSLVLGRQRGQRQRVEHR